MRRLTKRLQRAERIWKPLNVQRNEFRILELLEIRHEHGKPLICASVRNVAVSDHPEYDALSYCWGTRQDEEKMLLNEKPHFITPNLQNALLTLFAHGVSNIWVDALCIDQDDPYEKAAQVQRMATIFQEAEQVMIWLGSAASGSDEIMSFLKSADLSRSQQGFWGEPLMAENDLTAVAFNKTFMDFLEREYWYRTWIIQEIAVAQRVTIYCGNEHMDGTVMESLFSSLLWDSLRHVRYHQWSVGSADRFEHLVNVWSARCSFRNRQPVNLMELLFRTRLGRTSLDLDRVYAIMGLAFDQKAFISEPDYTLNPSQLCLQMSKRFMRFTGSIDLILSSKSFRGVNGNANEGRGLPSWCCAFVDFDSTENHTQDFEKFIAYISGHSQRLRCGLTTQFWNVTGSSAKLKQKFVWEAQALKTRGLRLGGVTSSYPSDNWGRYNDHPYDVEKLQCLPSIFDSISRLLMIHSHLYKETDRLRKILLHYTEHLLNQEPSGVLSEESQDKEGLREDDHFTWRHDFLHPCALLALTSYEEKIEVASSSAELVRTMIASSYNAVDKQAVLEASAEELQLAIQLISENLGEEYKYIFLIESEFAGVTTKFQSSFPEAAQAADGLEVWILEHCSMPVILERVRSSDGSGQVTYRVVSEALVDTIDIHGQRCNVMNGEAWKATNEDDLEWISII